MDDVSIPSVVAMLVCDQIIAEQGTNKKSLIGVFANFYSLQFPVAISRLAIYVKLADASGNYLFKLRLVKLKDESLVAEIGLQAQISDASQQPFIKTNTASRAPCTVRRVNPDAALLRKYLRLVRDVREIEIAFRAAHVNAVDMQQLGSSAGGDLVSATRARTGQVEGPLRLIQGH